MTAESLARRIVERLRQHGHEAYWAGGCVRDLLLGRRPEDYDVATSALPDQVLKLFPGSREVGKQFGVILVTASDGEERTEVEVATFRTEFDYRDGRRPSSVHYTRSPEEDARRRDFTINGLFFDPLKQDVLDYVGGRRDLDARLIRAIGNPEERFAEDKLRMLRAVRFAAALGFEIEPETFRAIEAHASEICFIAAERIRDELNRMLTGGNARRGMELLDASGLLAVLLPEATAMKGVEQPPEFHPEGDVWTHTLLMLDHLEKPSVTLAWGVLLHDVGKPPTFRVADRIRFDGHVEAGVEIAGRICRRLRFSNEETEQILALIANHMRTGQVQQMRASKVKRFLRMPEFDEHLELHRVDCLSSHRDLSNYEFLREKKQEISEEELAPPRVLSGHDLIAAGYEPGPQFSRMLAAVEDAQLEGALTDKESALEFVRERFGPPPRR